MVTNVGICRFCGQTHLIETSTELSEEMTNEAAVKSCSCDGSHKYRVFAEFEESMLRVCGEHAADEGFDTVVPEKALPYIKEAAALVYDGMIDSVQITISGNSKIKVWADSKTGAPTLMRREVRERKV